MAFGLKGKSPPMQKGWESSIQDSVCAGRIRPLDNPKVNELRLILDQVDDSIALFNSGHRLVQFNKSFVNHWKLPLTWLQSHPCWDEILAYLITQRQLTELQAKDIQYYLEHAKHQTCSFRILQADGCHLELQISTTAESNVLLVIKPKPRGIDLDQRNIDCNRLVEEAVRWSEFRYRQIVETAMEGIWMVDASNQITFVNQMMADMLDYNVGEMIGKSMFEFMDESGQEIALRNVQRLHQGIQEQQDFKFQRRDGSDLWAIVSTNPLFEKSGQYMGALGMLTDITERKQWEEFLQQANEQLGIQLTVQSTKLQGALHRLQQEMKKRQQTEDELRVALEKEKELSRLKSRFVAMASHEFGNPLTVVLTASQLLEHTNPCESRKASYLRMIQESVERMRQLMEDVLLIGKAEAEKVQVRPTELDINYFCCRLLGELRLSLGKNYHLQMVNLCSDPDVYLDAKLLRQILSNLLTNAVKYSPHGGTIRLEVMRQDKEVIFHVQDEGIGIPQKDLPDLFGSFNRAGNVGEIPGTGLGLAIVKHCVEALGGQISVTSQEDKGTTFRVALPLASPPTQTVAISPSLQSHVAEQGTEAFFGNF